MGHRGSCCDLCQRVSCLCFPLSFIVSGLTLGRMDILAILILPVPEHKISSIFHLSVSSSISVMNVLKFSVYLFFTSLVKFKCSFWCNYKLELFSWSLWYCYQCVETMFFFGSAGLPCSTRVSLVAAHRGFCSCGTQLSCPAALPNQELNPHTTCIGRQPLHHWATRGFPYMAVEFCRIVCVCWDNHVIFTLPFC